jgi:septum formation protein
MQKWILASQSPRRRELLSRLVSEFEVIVDDSDEVLIPDELPEKTVRRLAEEKARNVAEKIQNDALILAADTVVVLNNQILGKPKDEEDAFHMLSALSGNWHQVFTGIAVLDAKTGRCETAVEMTKVQFRALTEAEIRRYIESKEPMDKAGAYGIQDKGALLVEGIEGDYFNVVGLPLCRLGTLLRESFQIEW